MLKIVPRIESLKRRLKRGERLMVTGAACGCHGFDDTPDVSLEDLVAPLERLPEESPKVS